MRQIETYTNMLQSQTNLETHPIAVCFSVATNPRVHHRSMKPSNIPYNEQCWESTSVFGDNSVPLRNNYSYSCARCSYLTMWVHISVKVERRKDRQGGHPQRQ